MEHGADPSQLTHGRSLRRRVEAALRGELPLSALNTEDSAVFNAETAVLIGERLRAVNFGATLAAEGVTTVALDDDGQLVEHRPDDSTATRAERR